MMPVFVTTWDSETSERSLAERLPRNFQELRRRYG